MRRTCGGRASRRTTHAERLPRANDRAKQVCPSRDLEREADERTLRISNRDGKELSDAPLCRSGSLLHVANEGCLAFGIPTRVAGALDGKDLFQGAIGARNGRVGPQIVAEVEMARDLARSDGEGVDLVSATPARVILPEVPQPRADTIRLYDATMRYPRWVT